MCASPRQSAPLSCQCARKKERKQTTQERDGRTARRHHTGILRRGVWCASRRPPLGVRLFLSPFAVSLRISLQPSVFCKILLVGFCCLALQPYHHREAARRNQTRSRDPRLASMPLWTGWPATRTPGIATRRFPPAVILCELCVLICRQYSYLLCIFT